jgi:septal ring factor EnvC (AmiA/AmiB activator)
MTTREILTAARGKIAEVNTQLADLRRQIKQRDERIAKLEAALVELDHATGMMRWDWAQSWAEKAAKREGAARLAAHALLAPTT